MHSRRFDVGVLNSFRLQPLAKISVRGDQAVFSAARDPQQAYGWIRFAVQPGKIFVEGLRESARTECTDPREFIEITQSGQQRFRSSHGESRNSAGIAVFGYAILT